MSLRLLGPTEPISGGESRLRRCDKPGTASLRETGTLRYDRRLVLLCVYAPASSLTSRNRLRARIRLSCRAVSPTCSSLRSTERRASLLAA
jgi:hypothetical protein